MKSDSLHNIVLMSHTIMKSWCREDGHIYRCMQYSKIVLKISASLQQTSTGCSHHVMEL